MCRAPQESLIATSCAGLLFPVAAFAAPASAQWRLKFRDASSVLNHLHRGNLGWLPGDAEAGPAVEPCPGLPVNRSPAHDYDRQPRAA
mmetsp:Transcript_4580/g.14858  ORF Transcript_4580/g.14858 Transcript_4580/m.14858 type:complete len:88 (+) Transcript_4580:96-359(+)